MTTPTFSMRHLAREVLFTIIAVAEFAFVIAVLIFGLRFSPVLSGSMSEVLPVGSVAITAQVATSSLREGDVVKLPIPEQQNNEYVHRITDARIAPEGMRIQTKGDSNLAADPWDVVIVSTQTPKVVGHIPALGYLHNVTNQPWVRHSIVTAVLGLLVFAGLRAMRNHRGSPLDYR